jgi:hypothetical protein
MRVFPPENEVPYFLSILQFTFVCASLYVPEAGMRRGNIRVFRGMGLSWKVLFGFGVLYKSMY